MAEKKAQALNIEPQSEPVKERGAVLSFLINGSLVAPVDVVVAVPVGFGAKAILMKAAEAFVMNHPVGAVAIAFGGALVAARGGRYGIQSLVRRSREKKEKQADQ